jgi:pyrophosphatase PpaX
MPVGWDALLFDLDGTLADSVGLILDCYRHTMRTHLGRQLPDDLWMAGLGTPLDRQLAAFARNDDERAEMVETYRSYQRTVHDRMVTAFPGVAVSLGRFRQDGVPLGVVTSKHRDVTLRTLRVCGIANSFDFIITPEDVQRSKPDPEPVLAALTHVRGARPGHVLFVGDAPVDLQAGRAAGVRTAAALWGPFPHETLRRERPDFLVNAFADLLELSPAGR